MSEHTLLAEPPVAQELRVVEGPQRGARTPLPNGLAWLVHAGPLAGHAAAQADVALLASHAAQVQVRRGIPFLLLRLQDGAAELNGKPLAAGVDIAWRPGEALQLGETSLAYGPAHEEPWPAPPPQGTPAREVPSAAPVAAPPAPPRRWPVALATTGVVLVASSAALGLLTTLIPARPEAAPAPAASPRARHAPAPADLEAAVADVFRLHGIRARVAHAPGGQAIEVHTAEVDANRLARAEAAVRRDLPAVPALKVVNRAPARTAARPALEDDPGKRITGVVADEELPYLVTADGSRYFQGAWLPSGHRVVSIADRRVTVELDGVSTELSL